MINDLRDFVYWRVTKLTMDFIKVLGCLVGCSRVVRIYLLLHSCYEGRSKSKKCDKQLTCSTYDKSIVSGTISIICKLKFVNDLNFRDYANTNYEKNRFHRKTAIHWIRCS